MRMWVFVCFPNFVFSWLFKKCNSTYVTIWFQDLFTNPGWVCLSIFAMCDLMLVSGFTVYGPKYVEVVFSASPAMAGIAFGKWATLNMLSCHQLAQEGINHSLVT